MTPEEFAYWLRNSLPDGWRGELEPLHGSDRGKLRRHRYRIQLTHPRVPTQTLGPKLRIVDADRALVRSTIAEATARYRRELFPADKLGPEFDWLYASSPGGWTPERLGPDWGDDIDAAPPAFVWLARLKLRVVEIVTDAEQSFVAFIFDRAAAAVRADELIERGLKTGTAFANALVDGAAALRFDFESECCSQTWLADVVNPQALIGEYVTSVEVAELPEHLLAEAGPDGVERTREVFDQVYGWVVKSAKGACTLAVRNSSNGYYGGSVEFGGFLPLHELTGLPRIEKDWSA